MPSADFESLFLPNHAQWQIRALQDIVDWGQEIPYAQIEALFNRVWATSTSGAYRGLEGFLRLIQENYPEATKDIHEMRQAVEVQITEAMAVGLAWLEENLAKQLSLIVGQTGTKVAEQALKAAGGKFAPLHLKAELAFDTVNPEAVHWAETRAANLVTNIDRQMQTTLRMLIVNSVKGNVTPKQLARQVYEFIPLTPSHAAALLNRRAHMLADNTLGLTVTQIDNRLVDDARRLRRYRANNIARTETITANNYGVDQYYTQKRDKGLLPGSSVRIWIATRDDLTCDRCRPMHGKTSPIDGRWTAPGAKAGDTVYLPRPPLHPQCRCAIALLVPGLMSAAEMEDVLAPISA